MDSEQIIKIGAAGYAASKAGPEFLKIIGETLRLTIEPWQERRIARAKIVGEAEGQIEAAYLHDQDDLKRAARSFFAIEAKHQETFVEICGLATNSLDDAAQPQDISPDWLMKFYYSARTTSDEGMKRLWAKILAGQANSPGTFSKRTIGVVAELEAGDAQSFRRTASFVLCGPEPILFIYNPNETFFSGAGVTMQSLRYLEHVGLILSDDGDGFAPEPRSNVFTFNYFGKRIKFTSPSNESRLSTSRFFLSPAGKQLYTVCDPIEDPNFITYLLTRYGSEQSGRRWQVEVIDD